MAVGFLVHTSDHAYGDYITNEISLDTNEKRIDDELLEVKSIFQI